MYVKLTMGNEIVERLGIHREEGSNSFDVTSLIKVGNCRIQKVLRTLFSEERNGAHAMLTIFGHFCLISHQFDQNLFKNGRQFLRTYSMPCRL